MPPVVLPYIPSSITVHLGAPDSGAENVTVSFSDYVKNVVSSEVFPTWEPAAIRANALAITSYALNRVYTEYYRSRGYDFEITNTTAYDQKFIHGRNIYENISELVDEVFTNYIRRIGTVEPLAAKFCNGTTVTCEGLSQWGSQERALAGADSIQILRAYYGQDIEIVTDAPVQGVQITYPGMPLQAGEVSNEVTYIQTSLNRISQNYPAIPKVPVSGVFDPATDAAVRAFQAIFSLTVDGIVGKATWYQLVRIYVAVTRLSELRSEGQRYTGAIWQYPGFLQEGDRGVGIPLLQYVLSVLASFLPQVPPVVQNGVFDAATREAVEAYQAYAGLPVTGRVDAQTWGSLYNQYESIEETAFDNANLFPNTATFADSTRFVQFPGRELSLGSSDAEVSE